MKKYMRKILLIFLFCSIFNCLKGESKNIKKNDSESMVSKELDVSEEKYNISRKNVVQINDYAYELEKKGELRRSKKILEEILDKFPERTVSHLNYADVLWKLGEEEKSEEYYNNYIKLLIKNSKIENLLKKDKVIKFANGIVLKKVVSGHINKDNKKDYIIEYSNKDIDIRQIEQDKLYEMYKKGENSACLKIFVSEKEGYRAFNSCRLVIPSGIGGSAGSYGEENAYEIKNNTVIIRDLMLEKLSGFMEYIIELVYENGELMVSGIYSKGYSRIQTEEGTDFTESENYKKRINKSVEVFDVDKEFRDYFEHY